MKTHNQINHSNVFFSKRLVYDFRLLGGYLAALLLLFAYAPNFVWAAQEDQANQAKPLDFAHDVLPILKLKCAKCHTNGVYKGGLSLESREKLLESATVEIGSHANSDLYARITSTDLDEQMPPEGERLTENQIMAIKRWIDSGLEWPAELNLAKPSFKRSLGLRENKLPSDHTSRHPLDVLIDDYFQQNKIEPTSALSDRQFIRRAKLDLLGLLPTPDEIEKFVTSAESGKYNQLIDELVSRDREYADHWISFWNDLLRNDYAGTGYIDGGRKQITGWLHRSLYQNKPYDQFVRELISPSAESAGFIKGIKWRGKVNASQIEPLQFSQNVSQVFLGINMKCASCHDSFIDDWKLSDAYGLAAITSDEPLELHRCDVPTGEVATSKFVFPSLGEIDHSLSRTERLAQLAKILTSKENGRFPRTVVNRLWHRMTGRGLVHPVDIMANEAWSETILDFLAQDLVDHQYDLKRTLRLIATSEVYRSQSIPLRDSNNKFLFRSINAKRMTAEQFVDAVWELTGAAPPNVKADVFVEGVEPQGSWVWTDKDFKAAVAGDQVTFKYEFEIENPVSGSAVVTCDNQFEMFLNGRSVGKGDEWTNVKFVDFKKRVRSGKNVLLIHASNGGESPNPAVLFVEGLVRGDSKDSKISFSGNSFEWVRQKLDPNKVPADLEWQPAVDVGNAFDIYKSVDGKIRKAVARLHMRRKMNVRASLVNSDLLMRSLGRPNRDQVVTTRPEQLSTLQALDLSNGEILTKWLGLGAKKWLAVKDSNQWSDRELVHQLFLNAISRPPSEDELEMLVPLEAGTEPIEDLLWLILMLPEFQLVQ